MPKFSDFTIEQFVEAMVEIVDGQDDLAIKKQSIVQLAEEFNSRIMQSFAQNYIYSLEDLLKKEDIKDPFLMELRQAFAKCDTDSIFCSQLIVLLEQAKISLLERPDKMSYLSLFNFYNSVNDDLIITQLDKEDIWIRDLSFLSGKPAKQKPLGKAGLAKVPLGWLRSMFSAYWEVDAKQVEYLDSATKKLFKMRRISDSEPTVLYRKYDETHGERKPASAGHYLFALTKGFGLIAATSYEIDNLHHSSFLAGQPALLVGHIEVDGNGRITNIDCYSGHYTPKDQALYYSAIKLYERGFITPECMLSAYTDKIIGAREISVRDLLLIDLANVTSPVIVKMITRWREENPGKYQELKNSAPKPTLGGIG